MLHNLDQQKDEKNIEEKDEENVDSGKREQIVEKKGKRERVNVDVSDSENFYEMEMTVDQQLFGDELEEIKEGSFVSFKYHLEHSRGGPPVSPKIS